MKTKTLKYALSLLGLAIYLHSYSQQNEGILPIPESKEYQKLKEEGALPIYPFKYNYKENETPINPIIGKGLTRLNIVCDYWIQPDSSYTLAMAPNDDGSSSLINLPFSFCLYGDNYNSLYINNNGNVSFGAPYATFSANAFPDPTFVMVAPFWGDVDTRTSGEVWYKITPSAVYINWLDVGYFNSHSDKVNTFQLIITDGNDPILGVGNNCLFCYRDMQWTTGDASGGTNGFGGTPATVGANRGNGVDFVQFGQFDQTGSLYDGPFGNNDGVDWLDDRAFLLSTCVTGSNIAPILNDLTICDTIIVCEGEVINLDASFLAPESGQTITVAVDTSGVEGFNIISNTPGNSVNFMSTFTPGANNLGVNTIQIVATDDGTPPLSTTINAVFIVNYSVADFVSSVETIGFSFVNDPVSFNESSYTWPTNDSVINWIWNFGDGSPLDFTQNPTHVYQDTGSYAVTLIVEGTNGCNDTLTKIIKIIGPVEPVNVFSPNGDGKNDFFVIEGLDDYPGTTTLKVYNRWGAEVYSSDNYRNNWDGEDVADGVYYYVLSNDEWFKPEKYTTFDIPPKEHTTYEDFKIYGFVTILR